VALLEAKGITKKFGGLAAVRNLDFAVEKDEILGMIGPNGAGKTTVFNLITRVYPLSAGEISFEDRIISKGLPTHSIIRLGIGRTFQKTRPLLRLTVLENVMTSVFLRTNSRQVAEREALNVLEFTNFVDKRFVQAASLNVAGRKRLEIARALATEPKLLLLDEVAAGLNPRETEEVAELISRIRERGVSIIAIEHVMRFIMSISDRMLVMHHGSKIAEGTPPEVARSAEVIDAYLGEEYDAAR
jgi:branched-chain amino acid transport system ATP-binding protein